LMKTRNKFEKYFFVRKNNKIIIRNHFNEFFKTYVPIT
jgi:hypothetical protein